MKKYKKYTKRKTLNPYMIFAIVVIGILTMAIGYAQHSEIISIFGTANVKYDTYEITYVLNGGENPENAMETYRSFDDIPFPIPTKSEYTFDGWYDNENFIGSKIVTTSNLNKNISLYAKWKKGIAYNQQYNYTGEYVFTGDNYINTNVYLYTEENLHKNFLISFDIVDVDESNVNHNALMNSMDESGNPWSGHVVKVSGNGSNKRLKFESNSNTSSSGDMYIPSTVRNVRVIRINNILYCSFDGAYAIRLNNYTGFTRTFNVPVTFGASMDGKKQPFRFFTGTLANMSVSFIDDNTTIDDFNPSTSGSFKTKYEHPGVFEFDGIETYIDTGLCLFNNENFSKDFEISFNIDSVAAGNASQATILNAKNERITSYPGFVYRLYQETENAIKFESKGGKGSGASNKIKDVNKVRISRIDSKIYLLINDGVEKEVYDFTGFSNYFEVPITIGASLDSKGEPFRFFKGSLSNIVIRVKE